MENDAVGVGEVIKTGWTACPAPEKVYFGFWDPENPESFNQRDTGFERMARDFNPDHSSWRNGDGAPVPEDSDILFAIYHDPWGYSGQAFVLFKQGGKLLFVEGGHCSCHGLEGQWKPDEVTPGQLLKMFVDGSKFNELGNEATLSLGCCLIRLLQEERDAR